MSGNARPPTASSAPVRGGRLSAAEVRRSPGVDYADAFAIEVADAGRWLAEAWARAMFGSSPDLAERLIWRRLLGFPLIGEPGPAHVAGWPIVERSASSVRLANRSWCLTGALVVTTSSGSASLRTEVGYRRWPGRWIWTPLSAVHRRLVPVVLRDAHRALTRDG